MNPSIDKVTLQLFIYQSLNVLNSDVSFMTSS